MAQSPMEFLAFQQFQPQERKVSTKCIWCGEVTPKNRAHIISRKLATDARNAPVLRFNVCKTCNSMCASLELWILRFTPLSWVRLMLYLRPGAKSTTTKSHVLSYFFSGVLNDWIVFHLDGRSRSYAVSTQLLIPPDSDPTLLMEAPKELHDRLISRIISSLRDKTFKIDIHASLPTDFSARILLDNEKVLLVARTDIDAQQLINHAKQVDWQPLNSSRLRLENTGREQHHFRWSKVNWARFCAKTALESLCLFEGGEKCLRPAFRLVREFVIRGGLQTGREVVFDEKGPRLAQDVPPPVLVDLTLGQETPSPIATVMPHAKPGMHIVALYEIRGWVLASVVVAGFPPCVLILGGPDEHLADFYQLIYDDQMLTFDFVRLAYDQSKPIIPMPVSGNSFQDLAETYRLMHV